MAQHSGTQEHLRKVRIFVSTKRELLSQTTMFQEALQGLSQQKTGFGSPKKTTCFDAEATPYAEMTEGEIIRKAQAGDMRCFEALYARHKRRDRKSTRLNSSHSQ